MSDVMASLRAGVPITLLIDLAAVDGPDSACILATEAPDDDMTWLAPLTPAGRRRPACAWLELWRPRRRPTTG